MACGYIPSRRASPPIGQYHTAWWQRHLGVNNLPKVVTRQRGSQGSNSQPLSHQSDALATRLSIKSPYEGSLSFTQSTPTCASINECNEPCCLCCQAAGKLNLYNLIYWIFNLYYVGASHMVAITCIKCCVMSWFHTQFIACNALQFLCNHCRLPNVMKNIHGCNIFAPWIFSITSESLKLLHTQNCSTLLATVAYETTTS